MGACASPQLLMNDTEPFQRAHSDALRLLSYRPRSEEEVRVRLRRRFPAPLVEEVVDVLREQGLVDDAEFAKLWTASRDASKPRSAWAIKQELTGKGVARELAETAVQDIDDEESSYRAGLRQAQKLQAVDFVTFRRRLGGFLHRRGFIDTVSRCAINRLWEDVGRESHP